jgi:hypothetical protein
MPSACFTLFGVSLEQAADVVAIAGTGCIVDRLVIALDFGGCRKGKAGQEDEREQSFHSGILWGVVGQLLPVTCRTTLICASFSFH